jgi:hypothetical protein
MRVHNCAYFLAVLSTQSHHMLPYRLRLFSDHHMQTMSHPGCIAMLE